MTRVRFSGPAKSDLSDIANFLENEAGARVARTVLQRIRRHVRTLERDAHRYRERSELGVGRRAVLIGPYIAFYRIDGDTVLILRILHNARNITPKLFEE